MEILLGCLVGALFLVLAPLWWARKVWRRRPALPLAAKITGAVAGVLTAASGVGVVLGVVKAFGAVGGESIDHPRSRRLRR